MIKFLIVLALMVVLASLFSALFFLIKDQGRGQRVVNALLLRVILSALLLATVMVLVSLGIIEPHPGPF